MSASQKFKNSLVALTILATAAAPVGAMADERYIFRHHQTWKVVKVVDEQPKDITAFFSAGVGHAFNEKLPMRSDWEDDSWSVTSGTLPAGITFDARTRSFKGTPTTAATGKTVELEGFDALGRSVATAEATFDVYAIEGQAFFPDIYAHVGKYKLEQLPLPAGVTVETWTKVARPPEGITVLGRNFEGVPTKAGIYPIFLQAKDYLGHVVATYIGKYTVENGPGFPKIADHVVKLPKANSASFNFGPPAIERPIADADKVRYYLEVAEGESLPGSLLSNGNSKALKVFGTVDTPYQQASIRFKAIDSDGIPGWSNWFKVGTADPSPSCSNGAGNPTYFGPPTGVDVATFVPAPQGSVGTLKFTVASGQLPASIALNENTGALTGHPTETAPKRLVEIQIDSINGENTVSTSCFYDVEIVAGQLSVRNTTSAQNSHIRTGQPFTGSLAITGGIPTFDTAFEDTATFPGLSFSTATTNATTVGVEGTIGIDGLHSVPLKVTNGDGNTTIGYLPIYAHGPLAMPTPQTIEIQKYEADRNWANIGFDATTIVPDMSGATDQPGMVLSGGTLPEGIEFGTASSPYGLVGATSDETGTYGPFTVELSDYTGESVVSQPFNVVVTERADMTPDLLLPPNFFVEFGKPSVVKAFSVKQPPGAANLAITYALSGPALPVGVTFDTDTGEFKAAADIAYEQLGEYDDYTITATDSEGYSATSDTFTVSVHDRASPAAGLIPQTVGNMPGEAALGELPTFVKTPALRSSIIEGTVYGGQAGVTFVGSDPSEPAGLKFNFDTGAFEGEPTSEFDGTIAVTFKDTKNREGTIHVPLKVMPYPEVRMEARSFDIARLSPVTGISPSIVEGFRGAARWSLAEGDLPAPLTIDASTGAVTGRTSVDADTSFNGIKLMAVDTATSLPTYTEAFTINVKAREDLTVDYQINGDDKLTFLLNDRTQTEPYTLAQGPSYSVVPGGSFVPNLAFSIPTMPEGLSGISINSGTGRIVGHPDTLGTWTLPIRVEDADTPKNVVDKDVTIKSTLRGFVETTNGENVVKTLRIGEPLQIPADGQAIQTVNKVGSAVFMIAHPADVPASLDFDPITGVLSDESRLLDANPSLILLIQATDADNRHFASPLQYMFNVVDKLGFVLAQDTFESKQYDPSSALDITFPKATRVLKDLWYSVSSSDAPGTLVHKNYDHETKEFTNFTYETAQGAGVTTTDAATLPRDALVVDTLEGTLKGTPSKAGSFSLAVNVVDTHLDGYIRGTTDRIANNSASAHFTIEVAPAEALALNTPKTSEVLYHYTSRPTVVTTASNSAYGAGVTWTKVAGTLPEGISETKTGTALSFSGYPQATGTYSDIRYQARDVANRVVETVAVSFDVQNRKELELVTADNPIAMTVNETVADFTVTAANRANGTIIPASDWHVTGVSNLPPGITHEIVDGAVKFTGTATVIGNYVGTTVSATDAKGGTANMVLQFIVLSPGDAIGLEVSTINSKANVPFTMTPTVTNTYGAPIFTSADIAGAHAADLALNKATGTISGAFATVGDRTVNLSVSDATKRLTSKPVLIKIIPNLRVVVPSVVEFEQYSALNRTVDTDYKLGAVSYVKGNPEAWPAGISVDPASGKLTGTLSKTGTVSGLFITATDTFGGHEDTRNSNTFDISVTKSPIEPDITDITGMKLYTALSPITAITPIVTEKTSGKLWAHDGLTFRLNGSLPQGLSFNTSNGEITGTPAEPSYTEQLSITVSDEDGNEDTTTAFDIAVRDIASKLPVMGDYAPNSVRIGQTFTVAAPAITGKPSGRVTYTIAQTDIPGLTIDAQTGAVSGPVTATSKTVGTTYILGTDQSGFEIRYSHANPRGAILTTTIVSASVTYATVGASSTASANALPTVTNMLSPITFSLNKALPSGLSFNTSTGAITGTTTEVGTVTGYVVTATDSAGTATSNSFSIASNENEYWRMVINTWSPHSNANCVGLNELVLMSGATNITPLSAVTPFADDGTYVKANLSDGNVNTMWFALSAITPKTVDFKPPVDKPLTSVTMHYRKDAALQCMPLSVTFQKSSDKVAWTNVWSATNGAPVAGGTWTTVRP